MAKPKRDRVTGKKPSSGKMAPLNPWIPAVPVKRRGRIALKLVLAVPLAILASTATANPIPARTLAVPVEISQRILTSREFDRNVLLTKDRLLQKFEDKAVFAAAAGRPRGGGKGK